MDDCCRDGAPPLFIGCIAEETAREKSGSAVGVRLGAELAISDDISDALPACTTTNVKNS